MKIVICGSRGWTDEEAVWERISELPAWAEVIHGAARGADRMAAEAAEANGLEVRPFYADWDSDGKQAGFLRNSAMLDDLPDLVIAFWDGKSNGTKDTITKARKRGIPVEVVAPRGEGRAA